MKNDTRLESKHEIAYFVKCVPYKQVPDFNTWISPDFVLTIENGDIQDHTLLLVK